MDPWDTGRIEARIRPTGRTKRGATTQKREVANRASSLSPGLQDKKGSSHLQTLLVTPEKHTSERSRGHIRLQWLVSGCSVW